MTSVLTRRTVLKAAMLASTAVAAPFVRGAFAAGKPEPLTFALGLTHGLLWIFMSLACLTAARLRVVPLTWLAV